MADPKVSLNAALGIKGTLVVDYVEDGVEKRKEIHMNGSIPLSQLGMSLGEAEQLVAQQKEVQDGTHDRQ